ncbi:MAG: cyclic nucleotide-binding domain-containing protein [Bdellovibrio sp.]|nr:cyclic nucleotide-binding domain-containing protein [Bdellovibrio sp.]
MSNVKILKKGEYLFKEGDKIQTVFILQAGQVSVCLQKGKKNIDIMNVGAGYVFADQVVLGTNQYTYSGLAIQETKVVEIPIDGFKQQYEGLHQIYKSFIKTMAEKLKWTLNEVKTSRLEKSPAPCADDAVPKVFGIIFHVVNHKGLKDGNSAKVDWLTLRQYAQRIFGESFKRLESATQILVKLKLAEYIYGKSIDDPEKEEIQGFLVKDLVALESFFEFYQYYYYKGGKGELLKFDEQNYNTLRILLLAYEGVESDKYGIVSKDFSEVTNLFKDYGIGLAAGHFTSLESKGLFCKRKNTSDAKVLLQFEIKEFRTQMDIWKVLKEIDKWNEKGFVDIADVDEGPKKKQVIDGIECTDCKFVMVLQSKFCSECGAKFASVSLPSNAIKKAA